MDQLAQGPVILAKDGHHLLRLAGLGERGEVPQVAEDDGDLSAVAVEDILAGIKNEVRDLRGEEPAKAAEPLELTDLALDPGGQLLVPPGEFLRLTGDGVVVVLDPGQRRDPDEQLALVERLHDEVVSTRFEREDPLLASARSDQAPGEKGPRLAGADPPADLVAIHVRHEDVEENEVDHALGHEME